MNSTLNVGPNTLLIVGNSGNAAHGPLQVQQLGGGRHIELLDASGNLVGYLTNQVFASPLLRAEKLQLGPIHDHSQEQATFIVDGDGDLAYGDSVNGYRKFAFV